MMSYLWILLLGSLLAAHAKAQDDVTPAVEATSGPQVTTADVTPVVNEEPEAGKGTVTTAEEVSPTVSEPEPTAGPEAEVDQPVTPADVNVEALPTEDPAYVEGESDGKTEPETPAADVEAGAPVTTPAGDSEVSTPEAVQPTVNVEEEPATSAGTTPAQDESGPGNTVSVMVADKEEAPTDPDVIEESSTADDKIIPEVTIAVSINPGFNLEEAVAKKTQPELNTENPGFNLEEEDVVEEKTQPGLNSGFDLKDALEEGDENPPHSGGQGHRGKVVSNTLGEGNSSSLAGIVSAVVVCAVGAIAVYFTYQQKKLCFKNRQEPDPEVAHKANAAEAQSDPQVLSNLLNSS